MERERKRLILVSILSMIVFAVATVIAIVGDLRAENFLLGSSGLPAREDWVANGTAISPPLPPVAIQIVLTALVFSARRIGTVGAIGLTILGVLYIAVGALMEPITYTALNPATFDPSIGALIVGTIVLIILMIVFGVLELARRRRPR